MNWDRIEKIVIVGGGMAGWAAASCISNALRGQLIEIIVLDDHPDHQARIEASLPITQAFHQRLGINEQQLMRETAASFSLGTQFNDWIAPGHHYFQPIAAHGASIEFVMFHQYAIKARLAGDKAPFNHYSLCAMSAQKDKFVHPGIDPESILSTLLYAHHLDAGRYVRFMRAYASANGVAGLDATVIKTDVHPGNGFINSVGLDNGDVMKADLFIDCSGQNAVLAGTAMNTEFG